MSNHDSEHKEHILPLGLYITIGTTLILLTVVTVYVSFLNFGSFNLLIAMGIAAVKASLVALYFMHLKYDNKLYAIIFIGALLFLAVFIVITMFDTLRRDDIYRIKGGTINPDAVIYQQKSKPAISDSTFSDSLSLDSTAVDTLSEH